MAATHDAATPLPADKQQHMLLLFLPIRKNAFAEIAAERDSSSTPPPDNRAATGVHFAMFHYVPEGAPSFLPVPTFQSAPGKDLLVGLSIYDGDFRPYISAFTGDRDIASQLDDVLKILDETGIVSDKDHSSAAYIRTHGGVAQNNEEFIQLLMRYNFGDPTLAGTTGTLDLVPEADRRYAFHAVFHGLTVGDVINNYPQADKLWPWPPVASAAPELAAR